ncbi:MAG: hypothetical protein JNM78_09600 [Cyclobacteriaceae bacterium]|nr:hypothetical protein [Cyclobacteriaceae bacterium]
MKIKTTLFLIILSTSIYAQEIGELDRRNGFKEIKLGTHIDSIKGAELKKEIIERKEFPATIYETEDPEYMTIGDVAVKKISLKTYKGLIYEIDITTPKDPNIMRGLEKLYGKATYSIRTESYYWKGESLSLVYKGHRKVLKLTYRSGPVINLMYEDKGKKVEAVSDDF